MLLLAFRYLLPPEVLLSLWMLLLLPLPTLGLLIKRGSNSWPGRPKGSLM